MAETGRIRVLCADDHPLVRDGIAFALLHEADMELVGEAEDGEAAVEAFQRLHPDIVLMDLQMPRMNGLDALIEIRKRSPHAKVVVLTANAGDVQAKRALRSGAASYFLKDMLRANLIETIRSVHAGRRSIPPAVAMALAEYLHDDELTPREVDVLSGAAEGQSNKIIAERLGLTEQTVKGYLKNVFAKLGANDRTHAVTIAIRRGFLEAES
jgi:DNA-binding NarL/FixJ family response regulator